MSKIVSEEVAGQVLVASELVAVGESNALEGTKGGVVADRHERGVVSAEWAVAIIAAIALATLLVNIITGGAVESALNEIVLNIIKTIATVGGK